MAFEQTIDEIVAKLPKVDKEDGNKHVKEDADKPVVRDETSSTEEKVESPSEKRARVGGWVPLNEWKGDPDDWVDAKQFNVRGELMDRIKEQGRALRSSSKEIDNLKRALQELGEINGKIAEVQYKKALRDLQGQKAEAITVGDSARVAELEESIDELKEANPAKKKQDNDTPTQPQADPEQQKIFAAWVDRNKWYQTNPAMNGSANALGVLYSNNNPDAPLSEVLNYVEEQIKEEFPHKFKKASPRTPSVEPDDESPTPRNSGARSKSGFTVKDMSPDQVEIAETCIEAGALRTSRTDPIPKKGTKAYNAAIQQWVDQLAEAGDLPAQRKNR